MVVDRERQKLLVALASVRQNGSLDGASGTRNQKRAFINIAHRRRLVVWRGAQRGYRLTRRGERFLTKHSQAGGSFSKRETNLGTGLPLAGLLVFTVIAGAVWFERQQLDHPQRGPIISLRTAFETVAVKAPVTGGAASEPTMRNEASSLRLTTTPVSSLEDNLPDALPATLAHAPTQAESTGASTQHIPPRAGGNPRHHDKVHHVRRTKRAQDEPHRRYPTRNGFGYGWSPYSYGPWQYGWTR